MTIDRTTIEKVMKLARLELDDTEIERLTRDCQAILGYFEVIRELDRGGVPPAGALERAAPLREDLADADPLERPVEAMAPEWRDGYFLLPRLAAMDAEVEEDDAAG
jgi:aspartyl-tRNA(Asn)/glutamyl-tRNA(Gln) amidotransferase subunit C